MPINVTLLTDLLCKVKKKHAINKIICTTFQRIVVSLWPKRLARTRLAVFDENQIGLYN